MYLKGRFAYIIHYVMIVLGINFFKRNVVLYRIVVTQTREKGRPFARL